MVDLLGVAWNRVSDWVYQTGGPIGGHLETCLKLDHLLPPPRWYLKEAEPGQLWRSSQPAGPGWNHWEELHQRGIRSVVSLQEEEPSEGCRAHRYGIRTLRVPVTDNHAPTLAQVERILDFIQRPENKPCVVHCRAGVGRTGVVVACYRIAVQGWDVGAAIAEARAFGLKSDLQTRFIREFAAHHSESTARAAS